MCWHDRYDMGTKGSWRRVFYFAHQIYCLKTQSQKGNWNFENEMLAAVGNYLVSLSDALIRQEIQMAESSTLWVF